MQHLGAKSQLVTATPAEGHRALESELGLLKEVLARLPAGVTVVDEQGRFVLLNDAAARQLKLADADEDLLRRRQTSLELLRENRAAVTEEGTGQGAFRQVFLTSHAPLQIGGRRVLVSSSADITEQKLFEDQLFRAAYYDELTGLPSRRVIEHRANQLISKGAGEAFALAFLDLDNFKHINDYYGHGVGDGLLIELAKRLSRGLRSTDMLSRVSGDEFLLLLSPVLNSQEVSDFVHSTLKRLSAPFFIGGSEIFASTSVGVSLHPEHGRSFEALRQNADVAMYRVKSEGKGTAAFFDAGMEREALARSKVEQSLRLAILDKRFCCAFQTKVDIRSREIRGIEALVRLRDEEDVIQAPGSFINLAVELGLIDELTHLVLGEIVRSIDLINDRFGHQASISINVAAKQAGKVEFMRSFARALDATGFPKRFMLEVTEDAFVAKSEFQRQIVPLLREIGVGISIDDFGTGYSSLSALADITADEVKIDRSFITGIHQRPRSQGILRAVESLADALGMTVIVEGVESFEELAYLQGATKIRYAQGYYFSRPVFLEELSRPVPLASEARASLISRPIESSRPGYLPRDRGSRHS